MAGEGIFHSFFEGIIDYAGLFPPAKLPLEKALTCYRKYLDSKDSWILSRFILPATLLGKLTAKQLEVYSSEKPLTLSLIVKDAATDLPKVASFLQEQAGRVTVGSLEISFPSTGDWPAVLTDNQAAINAIDKSLPVFYELTDSPEWDFLMPKFIRLLAENGAPTLAFKLRCGGIEPQMVPPVERIAKTLLTCSNAKIPIKFTAGLHHPFRNPDEYVGAHMHGYFNVFFGGLLAFTQQVSFDELCAVLSEETDTQVEADESRLKWLGYQIAAKQVERCRSEFARSFGSCSFIEPIQDAKNLGWL